MTDPSQLNLWTTPSAPPQQPVLAFTGHRPKSLGGYDESNPLAQWVRGRMRDVVRRLKPETIISGFALGVDMWAAEIAVQSGIPLTAAIPFVGQELVWRDPKLRQRYHTLLKQANHVHIVSEEAGYAPAKMFARNEWMVDNCTVLCAIYNGSGTGGTAHCVHYARKQSRSIVYIDPREWRAA